MPPFELNLLKNGFAVVLMAPTVFAFGTVTAIDPAELLVILLSGVLGIAVGDTLYFRAINLMGASRTGIVGSLLSPFVILLSAIFLGERLTAGQWLGFALVMAGIVLITWKPDRSEVAPARLRQGLTWGLVAIFLMAVGVVMVKPLLETRSFAWVVAIRLFGGFVAMLAVAGLRRRWATIVKVYRSPHPWPLTLLACFLGGYLAMVLWLGGYTLIPASEASIYNEAQGSFIVFFAWLILGEKLEVRKLAGLALTVAGVITMLLV